MQIYAKIIFGANGSAKNRPESATGCFLPEPAVGVINALSSEMSTMLGLSIYIKCLYDCAKTVYLFRSRYKT